MAAAEPRSQRVEIRAELRGNHLIEGKCRLAVKLSTVEAAKGRLNVRITGVFVGRLIPSTGDCKAEFHVDSIRDASVEAFELEDGEGSCQANVPPCAAATSLHQAAKLGCVRELRHLLTAGVDPVDKQGVTPLMMAARYARLAALAELLDRKADPNHVDSDGFTPLMHAVKGGYVDAIPMLLERGAEPSVRNKDGLTAVELARQMRLDHAMRALQDPGYVELPPSR